MITGMLSLASKDSVVITKGGMSVTQLDGVDTATGTGTLESRLLFGNLPSVEWFGAKSPMAMYGLDVAGNIIMWSLSAQRIFGWTADEVMDTQGRRLVLQEEMSDRMNSMYGGENDGFVDGKVVKQPTKTGAMIETIVWTYPYISDSGETLGVIVFATKDFRTTQLYQDLQNARTAIERVVANSELVIFGHDIKNNVTVFGSEGGQKIYGYTSEEFQEDPLLWMKVIHPDDAYIINETPLVPPLPVQTEYRIVRKDGQIRWISNSLYPTFDENGTPVYVEGITVDVTERKLQQEKLYKMAYTDSLTHLPNRRQFEEDVRRMVDASSLTGPRLAVLLIDFDGFKYINDTYGHPFGDDVLRMIVKRMKAFESHGIRLYRIGGDEFTFVARQVSDFDAPFDLAARCVDDFREPLWIQKERIAVRCSIGVAIYPLHGSTVDVLLRNADVAMYTAKERGGQQCCLYSHDLIGEYHSKLQLHNWLTHAVERGEFELYYQPIVHASNNKLCGVEALIRWNSPRLGQVGPGPASFIPFAERSGLIWDIGHWVLRTACNQAKRWQTQGFPPIYVSVNVSMIQFEDPRFFALIQEVLQESALRPKWLHLEITESVVVRNPDCVVSLVDKLNKIGIQISMDDFGIGNSSLQYLPKMHIHTLKMDKSFIDNLVCTDNVECTKRAMDVISSIIRLAHTLDMNVVAEGVERSEQRDILHRLKCDFLQGYEIARPQPAKQFEVYYTDIMESNRAFSRQRDQRDRC